MQEKIPVATSTFCTNHTGGVMVDRVCEPRSDQTKDHEICICCFSNQDAALRKQSKRFVGSKSE